MNLNYDQFNGDALIFKYNLDEYGNPISIKVDKEEKQVSVHGTIQLEYVPDEYNRVIILNENNTQMTEVFNRDEIMPNTYYIDYNNGVAYLDKSQFGKTKIYNYYKKGIQLIGCSRIYDEHDVTGKHVVLTLQEIIDAGKEALRFLLDIGDAKKVIELLESLIAEGNLTITNLENKKNECIQAIDDAISQATQDKNEIVEEIQENIQEALDSVINVAGNKEAIIKSSQWALNGDVYEKEIAHDLNSENLHLTAKNSDTKEACTIGYKILDKTRILLKSDEAINMSIVLSASYYHATQTISDNIAEEVVKARKGELDLKTKIDSIDSQLDNINSIIDNLTDFSTTNKTKLPEIHFMNGSNDEDATLIKCSNGINVLIDCGDESTGNWLCDRLNKLGVTKLDYLFITHSHSDHVGGAVAVIERMKPSILYYKDITWELPSVETSWKTQEYHQKMIDKAKEIGVKLVKLTQLTTLNITDKEYFTFYNASIYSDLSDYNMNSLMIGYDYLGTKVLIQSDCLSEVANNKYNGQIGKVNLLKMVHHGGKDKTSKLWLNELRPDYTYYSHEDNDNLEYYKALTLTKLFTRDYNSHHSGCFIITSCGVTPTSTVKENKLANKIISFENKNCYVDNCGEVVENGFIECNGRMYYVRDWYIDKTGSYGDWIYVDDDSYCLYADGSFVRNEWVKSKVSNAWYYCSANGRPYKNTTIIFGTESVTFDENGKANKNFD